MTDLFLSSSVLASPKSALMSDYSFFIGIAAGRLTRIDLLPHRFNLEELFYYVETFKVLLALGLKAYLLGLETGSSSMRFV